MKVLFLTSGSKIPSSRFRVEQFLPRFRSRGIECTVRSAYGDAYNRLSAGPWGNPYKAACRLKRAAFTLDVRSYDVVFLQRTALPHTALPERLGARLNPRVIFDFDDAIFLGSRGEESPWRRRAFEGAVRASAHVVAGNRYLAERAGVPQKTTIIPTVIDTERYSPEPDRDGRSGRIVIGWMGTASNFAYLPLVLPAVRSLLAELPNAVFRVVSNRPYPGLAGEPQVEQVPWSKEEEVRLLRSFDVGLMPLEDNPWTRGKCGFKMIQYMAVGCPVVASAVGANPEIFAGSGAGFLVNGPDGWLPALRRLATDAELRRRAGASGREHVVRAYSIDSVVGSYTDLFARVAAG